MLQGEVFLNLLRGQRFAWLGGRFGGGKTALSIRIGMEFVDRGWADHIIGNFPCAVFTDVRQLPKVENLFIILDEAGNFEDHYWLQKSTAYLRKNNCTVLMPSVMPVPLRMKQMWIQRIANYNQIGAPVWRYGGVLQQMLVKEKFRLNWYNPHEIFGLYDTNFVVSDDAGIFNLFKAAYYERKQGQQEKEQDQVSSLDVSAGGGISNVEEIRRLVDEFAEVTERAEEVVSVQRRSRRRKRGN